MTTAHPSAETLKAFGLGQLSVAELAALEGHVRECDACAAQLAGVDDDTFLDLARAAAQTPPPDVVTVAELPELMNHPRYRIVAPLGEGGMGVVYKAEHKLMGRIVALKVINRELTANPKAVERFRREVKAAAQLNHPNIVTAHDAEEAGGLHFLVMEYVDGQSLDKFVARRGRLPVTQACHFMRQAALGLNHAHQNGLVHRDIKPQNLIVTRKGQIKILDFGLARLTEETRSRPQITAPNLVVGTPDFIAPEQARDSSAIDVRADLYSLGCTFYFLLAGRVPFPGNSAFEKLIAHTETAPTRIEEIRPDVPADVAAIVHKLMAKKPADRYATPADLAAALAPLAKPGATMALEAPPPIGAKPTPSADLATAETPTIPVPTVVISKKPSKKKGRKRPRSGVPLPPIVAVAAMVLILAGGVWAAVRFLPRLADRLDTGAQANAVTGASRGTEPRDGRPAASASVSNRGAAARRVLFIVPNNGLHYPDFAGPWEVLKANGVETQIASTSMAPCKPFNSKLPPNFRADFVLKENTAIDDYDAVIVVGGDVWEYMPRHEGYGPVTQVIRRALKEKKIVGAICTGQAVLGAGGFLSGKKIAASEFLKPYLTEIKSGSSGWGFAPTNVYRSGQVIVATGPAQGAEFGREILAAIAVKP